MLGLGLITGIAGRIRAQVAGWDLVRNAWEQEPRQLELARQLDANEVGRRANARRIERESRDQQGIKLEE